MIDIFSTGRFLQFTAARTFTLRNGIAVSKGSELEFDGSTVKYAGKRCLMPQLRSAITAGWLVPSSGFAEDEGGEWVDDAVERLGPQGAVDEWLGSEQGKRASRETMLKKAGLAVEIATLMLQGKPTCSEDAIEDTAVGLLYMPDQELIKLHARLAPCEADEDLELEEALPLMEQIKVMQAQLQLMMEAMEKGKKS